MRKSFRTKEYSLEPIAGTFSMKELRNFFSTKILEIEDTMRINENNIIWSQNEDNTQGLSLDNVNRTLNMYDLKDNNHTLRMQPNQNQQQRNNYTRWEFTFQIKNMIREYLFAKLKRNRTFAGIANNKTLNNSINQAIYDYIDMNVMERLNFATVDLYIQYFPLGEEQPNLFDENNNPVVALQFDNRFREAIISPEPESNETTTEYNARVRRLKRNLLVKKFQINTDVRENTATLIYKQSENAKEYKFDYYFDIIWEKA